MNAYKQTIQNRTQNTRLSAMLKETSRNSGLLYVFTENICTCFSIIYFNTKTNLKDIQRLSFHLTENTACFHLLIMVQAGNRHNVNVIYNIELRGKRKDRQPKYKHKIQARSRNHSFSAKAVSIKYSESVSHSCLNLLEPEFYI